MKPLKSSAKILITLGPIPGKLDVVKYVSNRFRGGLMLKLAEELLEKHNPESIEIVQWKYNGVKHAFTNILVEDIHDYVETVLNLLDTGEYRTVILGAAVANLIPSTTYSGKFPSHNYKVGDKISIDFEIAPRLIDMIKTKHPTVNLIGFKCSTGCYLDGLRLQKESKADLIIWNNPNNLEDITCIYKTGFHETRSRENLSDIISEISESNVLSKFKYTCDPCFSKEDHTNSFIPVTEILQYMELQKYVLADGHGAIVMISKFDNDVGLATPRFNKDTSILTVNTKWDEVTGYVLDECDWRPSQAVPHLMELHDIFTGVTSHLHGNFMVHCHARPKNFNLFKDEITIITDGYYAPNMAIPSTAAVRKVNINYPETKIIMVHSVNAGYYILANSFIDMIKLFTPRFWSNYNPPKRYLRIAEHSTDVDSDWYFVGGGSLVSPKFNLDPYQDYQETIELREVKKVKFINSLPIVGLKIFDIFTRNADKIYFNTPKQWDAYRIEECIDDKNSLEMSTEYNGVVGHCLVRNAAECNTEAFIEDLNTIHLYDKIDIADLYDKYNKTFEFSITETSNSYHVLMQRRV